MPRVFISVFGRGQQMKMIRMWGLLFLGIAFSMIPVVQLLCALYKGVGSYPTSSLVMGSMIGVAALIPGCISLLYFVNRACENADETIGPINTMSGLALWGAAGIVAAVLLVVVTGRLFGMDTSFLLLGQVLIPGALALGTLVTIGAVCAGTHQQLRFKRSPKLHLSKELEE